MELTVIVRSQAELTTLVSALVLGIDGALAAARAGGAHVHPPANLQVSGLLVTTLNADTIDETAITPANTVTTTETTPANTVTTTETIGAKTTTHLSTPPNRTTTRLENGGDTTEVNMEHEEVS